MSTDSSRDVMEEGGSSVGSNSTQSASAIAWTNVSLMALTLIWIMCFISLVVLLFLKQKKKGSSQDLERGDHAQTRRGFPEQVQRYCWWIPAVLVAVALALSIFVTTTCDFVEDDTSSLEVGIFRRTDEYFLDADCEFFKAEDGWMRGARAFSVMANCFGLIALLGFAAKGRCIAIPLVTLAALMLQLSWLCVTRHCDHEEYDCTGGAGAAHSVVGSAYYLLAILAMPAVWL